MKICTNGILVICENRMLTYEKCYGKTANTKKMTNFVISEQ